MRMDSGMKFLLLSLVFFSVTLAVAGPVNNNPPAATLARPEGEIWVDVSRDQLDTVALNERGRKVLDMPGIEWKHAQTDHFVFHYEQAIFARKVARMAEFFYAYIAQDLQGVKDEAKGRSHIFVFRTQKRWNEFRAIAGDVPEWTFSQVQGTVMYLQQADDTQSSGGVLAHEMTHLVVNRFFQGDPPIWLNEGLAEYYREFGYAAFKGIKRSKRAQFMKLNRPYPLERLLTATTYPVEDKDVASFYDTSKYLVAYLLLEQPQSKFLPFMSDMMKNPDAVAAFSKNYGLPSVPDIEKAFRKFAY